ncbi:MAG: 2,3-bisphosphoglycerate-independent phosphoglycerate mutase, partial [Acidaminococcaceae bacterium]
MAKKPVMLMILDGWGIAAASPTNAATSAQTPNLTSLQQNYPQTELLCSGEAVGLPAGQMGNSEVGHLNIGAGRVVYQELTRITKSIKDGDFFTNKAFLTVMAQVKEQKTALHLMGLVSDGGVHSHVEHLVALVQLAKLQGLKEVYIHAFLDGRDVGQASALGYLQELEQALAAIGVGKLATVSGRYYAMDRDQRWPRVAKAYQAMVCHEGARAT